MIVFQLRQDMDLPAESTMIRRSEIRTWISNRVGELYQDLNANQRRWITNCALSGLTGARVPSQIGERELEARTEAAVLLAARERGLGVRRIDVPNLEDAQIGANLIRACQTQRGIQGARRREELEGLLRRDRVPDDLEIALDTEETQRPRGAIPRRTDTPIARNEIVRQEPVERLRVMIGGEDYFVDIRPIAGRQQILPPGDSMQNQLSALITNGQNYGYDVDIYRQRIVRENVEPNAIRQRLNVASGLGFRQNQEVAIFVLDQPRTLVVGPTHAEPTQTYTQQTQTPREVRIQPPSAGMQELLERVAPTQQRPNVQAPVVARQVPRPISPTRMDFRVEDTPGYISPTPYATVEIVAQQYRLSLTDRDGVVRNYTVRIRGSAAELERWLDDSRRDLLQRQVANPTFEDAFSHMTSGMQRNIAVIDNATGRTLRIDERDEVLTQMVSPRMTARVSRENQTNWQQI